MTLSSHTTLIHSRDRPEDMLGILIRFEGRFDRQSLREENGKQEGHILLLRRNFDVWRRGRVRKVSQWAGRKEWN